MNWCSLSKFFVGGFLDELLCGTRLQQEKLYDCRGKPDVRDWRRHWFKTAPARNSEPCILLFKARALKGLWKQNTSLFIQKISSSEYHSCHIYSRLHSDKPHAVRETRNGQASRQLLSRDIIVMRYRTLVGMVKAYKAKHKFNRDYKLAEQAVCA